MNTPATVDEAFGTPGEDVTHWSASRVTGYDRGVRGQRRPKYERLTTADARGVHVQTWPIGELSLDTFRERWGHGTFRCHWQIQDPENIEASQRVRSGGNGDHFTLDELDQPEPAPVAPAAAPAFMSSADPMISALQFAQTLMGLSDARTNAMLDAVGRAGGGSAGGGNAEILARMAGLEAKIQADAERRTLEDAHRAQLAVKDTEISDLKRAKEDAEREAEREPAGSIFEPGTPILEQVPTLIANGIAAFAARNPEMVASIAASAWEKATAKAAAAAVNPAPPPAAAAPPTGAPPPRRVVHIVPQPARQDPLTPAQTAKAADPVPAQTAKAADPVT